MVSACFFVHNYFTVVFFYVESAAQNTVGCLFYMKLAKTYLAMSVNIVLF